MQILTSFLVLFLMSTPLNAITYGSNNLVSRAGAQLVFPSSASDNTMLGFISAPLGIRLVDVTTTATYNAFFPMSGNVSINGGILYLVEDLLFADGINIVSSGTVDGSYHSITFQSPYRVSLPLSQKATSVLTLVTSASFSGYTAWSSDWSWDNLYVAVGFSNGRIYIYQYINQTLVPVVSNFSIGSSLWDMVWSPVGPNYYLVTGSNASPGLQVFQFTPPSTLALLPGAVIVQPGSDVHACSWHPTGKYIMVYSQPYTAPAAPIVVYSFDGTTLTSVATDSTIPSIASSSYQATAWNAAGTYFAMYTGAASPNSTVYIYKFDPSGLPILTVTLTQSFTDQITYLSWSQASPLIALAFATGTNRVQLWNYDYAGATLTFAYGIPGIAVTAQNCEWSDDGNYIGVGINASTGALSVYYWDPVAISATLLTSLPSATNNINRIRWASNSCDIVTAEGGSGTGVLGVYTICTSGSLIFKNVQILFNSPVDLNWPIRFQGSNIINAQGNTLSFGPRGAFNVDPNSSLLIENAEMKHIVADTIACADNTSTLSVANVVWSQDANYTFSFGKLAILDDVNMTGNNSFIYSTSLTSTIYSGATWYFDRGMTFSYASSVNNLILFENRFSTLHLYEALLYAGSPGLTLTKGTLALEGQCLLVGNAATAANGIWIGDGMSSSNNMSMRILAESGMYTGTGYVVYANV